MPLDFRFGNVTATEFGVGREAEEGWKYAVVPVDRFVQEALQEMASTHLERDGRKRRSCTIPAVREA